MSTATQSRDEDAAIRAPPVAHRDKGGCPVVVLSKFMVNDLASSQPAARNCQKSIAGELFERVDLKAMLE